MTPTLQRVLSMPPAERDAMVAEKVLGWRIYKNPSGSTTVLDDFPFDAGILYINGLVSAVLKYDDDDKESYKVFEPSADANDDYAVLAHCREKWLNLSSLYLQMFIEKLPSAIRYNVGDYAIAALATVIEMEEAR